MFYLSLLHPSLFFFFFFNDTATTEIYTLSLHDALPIFSRPRASSWGLSTRSTDGSTTVSIRSEEHTSELQSHSDLVCRLLLEKKKKKEGTQAHNRRNALANSTDTRQRRLQSR